MTVPVVIIHEPDVRQMRAAIRHLRGLVVFCAVLAFAFGLAVGDMTAEPRFRQERQSTEKAAVNAVMEARVMLERARAMLNSNCFLPWGGGREDARKGTS